MKKVIFLLMSFALSFAGVAQLNLDSLQKVLAHSKKDSVTLQGYLVLMNKLESDDPDAIDMVGKWVIASSDTDSLRRMQARAMLILGVFYVKADDYVSGTSYLTRAQEIAEKYQFPTVESYALNSLAGMYLANKQNEKAVEYYQKSIGISKKHNNQRGIGVATYNLGGMFRETGFNSKDTLRLALAYCMEGLRIMKAEKDTQSVITFCNGTSSIYVDLNEPDSALQLLNEAEQLIKATGKEEQYATHYLRIGQVLSAQKKYREAIVACETGLRYAGKYSKPRLTYNYYTVMAQAYEDMGDYKNANKYNILYSEVHDSLINKENFALASDIQNKYERQKKDNEILKLNQDKEIAAAKRKQLTIFLIAALIGFVLLAVLLFLLLKNIRGRKKAYRELQDKSIQIQEQALQLSKQAKLIAQFQSQMNPHFVFNALHNIQGLVISNENSKATSQIQSLAQLMRKTFANAEKDDILLNEEINYLKKYVDFEMNAFNNPLEFKVDVSQEAENAVIPPMMIQPFVENAIKHAGLKKVENPYIKVLIDIEENLLRIVVKDNGAGIKKSDDVLEGLSHSMSVIKARIELLFQEKGKPVNSNLFSVKTVPETDAGTTVKFYLPLNYAY
ncbi:MAG: histidine kinase [Bacteroidota bacterium]